MEFGHIFTLETGAHTSPQLQEAANPQLHRNLEVYLPLKLTGAEGLSPPVQKLECTTCSTARAAGGGGLKPEAGGGARSCWNASWLGFS